MYVCMYCGVFTPCKNSNIETRSHDYATVDEAVISPSRAVTSRASPRYVCCQTTAINTWMTQECVSSDVTRFNSDATIEAFPGCQIKGLCERLKLVYESVRCGRLKEFSVTDNRGRFVVKTKN
jgi:hypothetical protein